MATPTPVSDSQLAKNLQDEECAGTYASPPATAQPYSGYVAYSPMPNYDEPGTIPVYGTAALTGPVLIFGAHEQRLLDTFSLGRGIRVLAMIDAIILLINAFFSLIFLIVFWGPVCGYLAGTRYNIQYGYAYAGYYVLRIIADIALISLGAWWFILSLIVDVIIIRYVLLYCQLLRRCSPADVQQLSQPNSIWTQSRPYFVIF